MATTKKISGYRIDFTTDTLIMNYKFYAASQQYGSPEYNLVKSITKDFPNVGLFQQPLQFCVGVCFDSFLVRFWNLNLKIGQIFALHKEAHERFQIPRIRSHRNIIQIGVIPQRNNKVRHCVFVQVGNQGIRGNTLVNLLDGFSVMPQRSIS